MSEIVIRQISGVLVSGLPTALISFFVSYALWRAYTGRKPAISTAISAFLIAVFSYSFGASIVSETPQGFDDGNAVGFIFIVVAVVTVFILSIGRSQPTKKSPSE